MLERAVVRVGRIRPFVLIRGAPETPPNAYFPESSDKYLKELYERHAAETIEVLLIVLWNKTRFSASCFLYQLFWEDFPMFWNTFLFVKVPYKHF